MCRDMVYMRTKGVGGGGYCRYGESMGQYFGHRDIGLASYSNNLSTVRGQVSVDYAIAELNESGGYTR